MISVPTRIIRKALSKLYLLSKLPALENTATPCLSSTQKRNITTEEVIVKDQRYGAHHYHPIPAALSRGRGVFLWDVEGKRYFDFLSGYSAANLGHCHPRVVQALREQAGILHHTSRAFYTDALGEYSEFITRLFGYDKVRKIL